MVDIELIRQYCRIDYDDDNALLYLLRDAAMQELGDIIPGFSAETMTARQELLCLAVIKDLYDNREKYDLKAAAQNGDRMRQAVRAMFLREFLGAWEPDA